MKTFKKIIFLMLIANSTSSVTFGMTSNTPEPSKDETAQETSVEEQKTSEETINELIITLANKLTDFAKEIEEVNGNGESLCSLLLQSKEDNLKFMLEAIPENQRFRFFMSYPGGSTLLHRAIELGQVGLINVLINVIPKEQRFSIFMARDKQGCTILFSTLLANIDIKAKVEIFKILIEALPEEHRADFIMAKSNTGTLLHYLALDEGDTFTYNLHEISFQKKHILDFTKMLIDALPEDQRTRFVMTKCKGAFTAKQSAQRRNKELANLLSKYDKNSYDTNSNSCNIL